jgi:hypothetical protein
VLRVLVALAMVLGIASAPAYAVAADEPSDSQLALVDRMMRALQLEQQIDAMLSAMTPAMVDGMPSTMSPELKQLIMEVSNDVVRDTLMPRMLAQFRISYARIFTETEMVAVSEFYEGPAGRAMLAKTPQMALEAGKITRDLMPLAQAETLRRLCEKIDCRAAGIPRTRSS